MRRIRTEVVAVLALVVLLVAGCGRKETASPLQQQLADVQSCLEREGYGVKTFSFRTIPWLPAFNALPVPFLSRRVSLPILSVDVGLLEITKGGFVRAVGMHFYPTAEDAREEQRRLSEPPLYWAQKRVRNVLYDWYPDVRHRVFGVIERCVRSSPLSERAAEATE